MNGLAWSIVDPSLELETRNLELAMRAAKQAVALLEDPEERGGLEATLAEYLKLLGGK